MQETKIAQEIQHFQLYNQYIGLVIIQAVNFRLTVAEYIALRRTFGPKRDEVQEYIKLRNEKFNSLYFSSISKVNKYKRIR
jgi:hypothetical protein